MVPPSEQIHAIQITKELFEHKSISTYQAHRKCKDGTLIDVSITLTLMTDDYNEPVGVVAVYRDIREPKSLHQRIKDQERQFNQLISNSIDVIATINENRIIRYLSPSVRNILGYEPDALLGVEFYALVHPEDATLYRDFIHEATDTHEELRIELRLRHNNGHWRTFSLGTDASQDKISGGLIFHFHDITEEKELRDNTNRYKTHDPVTGLGNRKYLAAYLVKLCSDTNTGQFAFLHVELKDFRQLVDAMDTHQFDKLTKVIADRFQQVVPSNAFVGHINDIEFGIVMPYNNVFYVEQLAERISESFNRMIHVDKHHFLMPCNIGICLRSDPQMSAKTVWKNADYALTLVRQHKTSKQYLIYNPSLDVDSFKYHQLREDLSSAIDDNQFEVYYQPQVNGATGEILGAEALIRWNHPQWGVVLPREFIPQAEATGLINSIGDWVLKTACNQMAQWHRTGYPGLKISINFSPKQFLDRDIEQTIDNVLTESNLNPSCLEIEVTENGYSNLSLISTTLSNLKERLGLRVAIDDFGTGEATLLVLREITADVVKIDKKLISDITDNQKSLSMVRAVKEMSRALNCTVVAEGVERKEQVECLLEQKCLYMQGYYFSEPLRADAFTQTLRLRRIQTPVIEARSKRNFVDRTYRISLPHRLSGQLTLHSISGQLVDIGYSDIAIRNIGTMGISFDSSIRFSQQADLLLKFFVNLGKREFQLIGHIIWSRELGTEHYRYGTEFVDSTQTEELISALDQLHALLTIDDTPLGYTWIVDDVAQYPSQ